MQDINDFISEVAERKLYSATFTLMPKNWQQCMLPLDLKWKVVRFEEKHARRVPNGFGGVYTFVLMPGIANHPRCAYLLYVGKAQDQDFQKRYQQYLYEKANPKARPLVRLMLNIWDSYLWFCYAQVEPADLIPEIEDRLIRAYDPIINRTYPADIQPARTAASL